MKLNCEDKALLYAEKFGIIDYEVINDSMVYYEKFLMEGLVYKVKVNLNDMKECRTVYDIIQL